MKKKILKIALVTIVTICTTIGVKSAHKENESPLSLIFANVEALASSSEGHTETSWNCIGNVGKCYASCGACGTVVRGSGDLVGTHKCSR